MSANFLSKKINKNTRVTAWIYFALCLITLLDELLRLPYLVEISTALVFLFVVLEFRLVPRAQQIAGSILIFLSLIAAVISDEIYMVIVDGIGRSRIFLLLFFAISWLQFPVKHSPTLNQMRDIIISQPPARQFVYMAFGAHILGTVLNIAGLSLLTSIVEKQKTIALKRSLSVILMQGFTSASCWSPFYIGMIVVLVALPSLNWADVAPAGGLIAVCIMFSGWIVDQFTQGHVRQSRVKIEKQPLSSSHLGKVFLILLSLVGIAMAAVELLETNIPVALALIGPSYALIWYGSQRHPREQLIDRYKHLIGQVIPTLPTLRNESLLFVAAHMFGVGLASVLPSEDLSSALHHHVPSGDIKLLLLIILFVVCSAAGLHPIIVVISVSTIFPPAALGLSDWIVALTFLGCWGISTMVSPFSGTTLFMSRVTGVPGHVIGWSWTPPTVLIGAASVGLVVLVLRHLAN